MDFTSGPEGITEVFCGGWPAEAGEVWIQLDDVVISQLG